ncbi:MAG: serine hydrolase domain-containing protein [Microthrixaceae bacterium]
MTLPAPPTVPPESMGVDPEAIEAAAARIQREVDEGLLPAAQLAVARNGTLVCNRAFGAATPEHRFAVYSCTKAFTGGIIWQLLGDRRLNLEDPAADYVPSFGTNGKGAVTIAHLLTHTGGFPQAPLGPPRWASTEGRNEAFSRWRLITEPGSAFEYHPTAGHWVLGAVAEAVLNEPLGESIARRLCEPLGLGFSLGGDDACTGPFCPPTATGEPPTAAELRAAFGLDEFDLGEVTPAALTMFADPAVRAVGVPGGGGVATAADLARYYQALLANTSQLWHPDALALATSRVLVNLPDPLFAVPASRSAGLVIAGDDGNHTLRGFGAGCSPRSFGHNGAAGQIAWADPDTGLSVGFVTSGIDQNFIRQARRTLSIGSKVAAGVKPARGT